MNELKIDNKVKKIFGVRIFIQLLFIIYLIITGSNIETIATFLISIIASEGYKILGSLAISQNHRFRELVGLIIGVLNGIIFMVTIYLTGYAQTEIWLFSMLSISLLSFEYGIFGSIAEGLVMSAFYIMIGGIEGMDYGVLILRSVVLLFLSGICGYVSNQEIIFERRFLDLEKRRSLTRDQKSRFIGLISHSLRTPMTTIRGYVDLLFNERAGKLNKEQKDLVDKLRNETNEIQDLVEDFLTISTLESEQINLKYSKFNICELCEEIYEEMMPLAKSKGVNFKFEKDSEVCELDGERSKLENSIKNIIDNAIKFTPEKGTVKLSLNNDEDYIYISISDTGIGIPESEQKNLFGMFARATNILKYDYEGVGLGLYMSRLIIQAHGGRIELESEEGVGSKFTVILPIGRLGKVIRKISGRD